MTLTSRVFGMTGLKMEDTVEWHADANFCRAPSFMLDRMQDPDNFEDFRHATTATEWSKTVEKPLGTARVCDTVKLADPAFDHFLNRHRRERETPTSAATRCPRESQRRGAGLWRVYEPSQLRMLMS